ncbi:hypothetical protein BHM03_00058608 [Ensete ventricosum]|nr:hypothetical protein BHM03_00058608 [Ensete ventricosum]
MSKHRAGVRTMRLATRLECIGSSPRVSEACQDGTREFTGRKPRLVGRLSGVAERLTGSWEGLEVDLFNHDGVKELQIRHEPKIKLRHRAKDWTMWVGAHRVFARNSPGDRQRKIVRLVAWNVRGCRIAGVRSQAW